jgi:hypothetical protein
VGEGTTPAVREIEEARERLQNDFEELASRLPRLPQGGEVGAKVLVPAVGALAGGLVIWLADRKRKRRRAVEEAAEVRSIRRLSKALVKATAREQAPKHRKG